MKNGNNPKEERIIYWLHEFKRLPTSRFTGLLGLDYPTVQEILEQMEKKGILIKDEETKAVYWRMKNDSNNNHGKQI